MREILNANMEKKVYAKFKTSFKQRQCYIFMSLAQGSCAIGPS